MVVAGPPLKGARGEIATIRFGPGQPEIEHPAMLGKLPEFGPAMIASSIELVASTDDDESGWETFSHALPGPVTLETGAPGEPFARVHPGAEELSQTLGAGRLGEARSTRNPEPTGNPGFA